MQFESKRTSELDGIRGIACIFVLIHHYFTGILGIEIEWRVLRALEKIASTLFLSGVDLFLVLSGFLIGGIIIDRHKSPNFIKVFLVRRICRIFPVYYALMITFVVGTCFLTGKSFFDKWLLESPLPLWPYMTFLQSYVMGTENTSGPKWVAITWSVSVEEQFYLLLPLTFLLLGRKGALAVAVLCIITAPLVRHLLFEHLGFYAGYMFFPARMDTPMWGVLLAYLVRSEECKELAAKYALILASIAVLLYAVLAGANLGVISVGLSLRFSMIALFYSILMWAVLEQRAPWLNAMLRWKLLITVGHVSYAAYMFHQLINGLVHGYLFNTAPLMDGWPRIGATLVSTGLLCALCALSLKFLEGPIRRYGATFNYAPAAVSGERQHPS